MKAYHPDVLLAAERHEVVPEKLGSVLLSGYADYLRNYDELVAEMTERGVDMSRAGSIAMDQLGMICNADIWTPRPNIEVRLGFPAGARATITEYSPQNEAIQMMTSRRESTGRFRHRAVGRVVSANLSPTHAGSMIIEGSWRSYYIQPLIDRDNDYKPTINLYYERG